MFRSLFSLIAVVLLATNATADGGCPASTDFGCYMAKAAHLVVKERGNLGWSMQARMTRDFKIGDATVKADPEKARLPTRPGNWSTSCNGAVLEIWFRALQLYKNDHPEWKLEDGHVPLAHWNSESLKYPRAHIAMYEILEMPPVQNLLSRANKKPQDLDPELQNELLDYDVRSIAHGLERFGLAQIIPVSQLRAGDLVTFDRKTYEVQNGRMTSREDFHSTHSVIFISWLDANQSETTQFALAKGFKYVSSQSNVGGSGLGYRWAYFKGFCPQDPSNVVGVQDHRFCPDQRKQDTGSYSAAFPRQLAGQKSDCCVIPSDAAAQGRGIVAGRVKSPSQWSEYQAKQKANEDRLSTLVDRVRTNLAALREARR